MGGMVSSKRHDMIMHNVKKTTEFIFQLPNVCEIKITMSKGIDQYDLNFLERVIEITEQQLRKLKEQE